jgi:hypothetical protein
MKLVACLFAVSAVVFACCTPAMAFINPSDPDVRTLKATEDDGFSRVDGETLVNRGKSGSIRCKGNQEMVLMKFDVSSVAGWTVTEAELHVCASSASLLYAADVCTICVPWNEGVTSGGFNNGSPGDPCWDWRHIPVNMSSPAPGDYWTTPGSDMTYATYGNNGSLVSYAWPGDQGFTTYTASTPGGTNTFYRIKVAPDVIHALIQDQYGLTLSDTRGYLGQNNTVYTRDQWGTAVAPTLYIKGGVTDTTPPSDLSGMTAAAGEWNGQAVLSWTAPADSGPTGKALGYDVRYSAAPITAGNFAAATQVDRWRIPRPAAAGTAQTLLVEGLTPGTTYYFAMKAYDQAGNKTGLVTASVTLPAGRTVMPLADAGFVEPAAASSVRSVPGVLRYWAVSEYTKVNPVTGNRMADGYTGSGTDGYKKSNPVWDAVHNKVMLRGARNEVVGFQLILERIGSSLTNVGVSVGNLTRTGGAIASSNMELSRSYYVPSGAAPSIYYYPDACIPLNPTFGTTFAIPNATNAITDNNGNAGAQTNQAVWVDIYVPKGTAAGTYNGTITVTADQLGAPLTVDLELVVRNWQLPDKINFIVDLNGYHTPWDWGQGTANVATTKRSYFQIAHKHRQNVNTVPHSHTLTSAFKGRIDADRIPSVAGSGAGIYVTSWTTFDSYWAAYLDGTAFSAAQGYNGPGMNTPVSAFYTPFFESWPLSSYDWYDYNGLGGAYWYTLWPGPSAPPVLFLQTAPGPRVAYPAQYETGVKNIIKAFAEHAQALGWTGSYMQFYLNNKYSYGSTTTPHSQFWNLDEPSHGDCMDALGYFHRVFREGVASATAPDIKWHYRIDISDRAGQNRGTMDGLVNLWDCSAINDYHSLITHRQRNWSDEQWWYYGGGVGPNGSETANSKRFLQVWCWYVDGALPYWNSYSTNWAAAEPLSVLYSGQSVPGYGTYYGGFASQRMKEMRRGQQDVEYLVRLANRGGWSRSAVIRALQDRYADAGGDSYDGMTDLTFFQMREDLAATIPLAGDANDDGHVNVTDLLLLVASWAAGVGDANYNPACDFDGNGLVDISDLLVVANNWGT